MAGEVQLNDVAEIIMGQSPPGSTYNESGVGLPFFQGVRDFNYRHPSIRVFCSEPTRIALPGDILFSVRAPIGRVNIAEVECSIGRGLSIIRARSHADRKFIEFALRNMEQQWQVIEGGGSVFGNATRRDLATLSLPWPGNPLEREAIGYLLGALDDKIELNRRMNRTLEEMARAIFKSWFVDFDPVRAKAAGQKPPGVKPEIAALFPDTFEPSELGEIPKGWRVDSLDGIANYLNGLALQKYPPKNAGTLPVIKIAQLRKGDSYGADLCSANLPTDYIIQDGDVLFSWSGSLEVEIWCGGAGALNQHLFKVTSHRFKKWFFFLWTLHHLNDFRLIAADKATTMGHIQRKHLSDARVLIPSKPLMDSMDNLMDPLVERVVSCRLESRTLAALRDTLLPKLISGELRVPDVERIAGRCL